MEDASYGTLVGLEDHYSSDNWKASQFMVIDANNIDLAGGFFDISDPVRPPLAPCGGFV